MGTYSLVSCDEEHGTVNANYSIEGGIQASVGLRVTNANKELLVDDLLSNQREWPHTGFTEKPRAYAASLTPVATEGPGGGAPSTGQTINYTHWIANVSYTTDPTRTLISESIEPSGEFVRLDHRLFRWNNDNAPLLPGESPGILRRRLKLTRRLFQQPAVPTAILSVGAVHNAAYASPLLGITFAANTLLLEPQPVERTITTAGSEGFNYTISFLYQPEGWNKYWRTDTQAWDSIKLADGTAYNSYPPTNLSALLNN